MRLSRLLFMLAVIAAPPLAGAQALFTITETGSASNDGVVNIAECDGAPSSFVISWVSSNSAATSFNLWVGSEPFSISSSATSCLAAASFATDAHTQLLQTAILATSAGSGTAASITGFAFMAYAGIPCTAPVTRTAIYLCLESVGGTTSTIDVTNLPVDLSIPPVPTDVVATAGDSHVALSWTAVGIPSISTPVFPGTVRGYQLFVTPHGEAFPTAPALTVDGQGTTSGDVTGLTNGTAYDLEVVALSGGGNPSTASAAVTATPELEPEPKKTGGCSTGGAGLMALLGLIPLARRRKAKRAP